MRVASAKVRSAMHLPPTRRLPQAVARLPLHLDDRKDLPLFGQPSRHTTVERQPDA